MQKNSPLPCGCTVLYYQSASARLISWTLLPSWQIAGLWCCSYAVQSRTLDRKLCASVNGSLEFCIFDEDTAADSTAEPELIARDLLEAVGACLEGQTLSWDSTLCMRVFYKQSLAGHRRMLSGKTFVALKTGFCYFLHTKKQPACSRIQ